MNFVKKAAENELKGIVESTEELVSSDIVGNDCFRISDSKLTAVMGNLCKGLFVVGDNEYGYSCRVVDLAKKMMK